MAKVTGMALVGMATSAAETLSILPALTLTGDDQRSYPFVRISRVWLPGRTAVTVAGVVPRYSLSR